MIPFALNHLWQSTWFAAAAGLLAQMLRRHPARARFWLWMAASLKLLVPLALLAVAGSHLSWRKAEAPPTPKTRALTVFAQPFAPVEVRAAGFSPLSVSPAMPRSHPWVPWLFALWTGGLVTTITFWTLRWRRLAQARHAAQPADGALARLPVPVLLTDSGTEPGVFGIFRPVLLLPAGLAGRLSPEQTQAVIAHELCHVRRRDNLWAALHMIVEAVFWFNPLVWWLGGRLVAEREQACDEAVLAEGADPERYARSILQVCRYYACTPLPCAAGVAGADLQQRIAAIMRFGLRREISRNLRLALAALALAAIATPIVLGRVYGPPAQDAPRLSFDVASIHEWGPGQGPAGQFIAGVQFSTGRVRSQCASLKGLIFYAYDLTGSEPVEGLPQWANASCGYPDSAGTFTIEATMPANTTAGQARQMMQTLLIERFKLAARWETKQLPVYALMIAPGKLKLKPSDPDRDPPTPPGSIGCPVDDPHCHIGFCCGSTTITTVAGTLSHALGRPVIDKTGLTGSYYFGVLKWAGDDGAGSPLRSLPTLLHEEFGLELKAETGPVPMLVIDHAEKPAAN